MFHRKSRGGRVGRPPKFNNSKVFTTKFEYEILGKFAKIMHSQGRNVNDGLQEFMQEYNKIHDAKKDDMTLEKWFESERFFVTPALFDKSSIWDNFMMNDCIDKELFEIIDQCDALGYHAKLTMSARRLARDRKRDEQMLANMQKNDNGKVEEIFNRAVEESKK